MAETQTPAVDTDATTPAIDPVATAAQAPATDDAGRTTAAEKAEDDLETQEVVAQIGIPD